jgi:hypothetical protein
VGISPSETGSGGVGVVIPSPVERLPLPKDVDDGIVWGASIFE